MHGNWHHSSQRRAYLYGNAMVGNYERHDDHHDGIPMEQAILIELRELRTDFNEFARGMGERLATHDAELHTVLGNGQPGRLSVLETKVSELQRWHWKIIGMCTGLSSGAAVLIHFWK